MPSTELTQKSKIPRVAENCPEWGCGEAVCATTPCRRRGFIDTVVLREGEDVSRRFRESGRQSASSGCPACATSKAAWAGPKRGPEGGIKASPDVVIPIPGRDPGSAVESGSRRYRESGQMSGFVPLWRKSRRRRTLPSRPIRVCSASSPLSAIATSTRTPRSL